MSKIKFANVILLLILFLGGKVSAQESIIFEESFFPGGAVPGIGPAHINVGSDKFRVYESFEAQVGAYGYSSHVSGVAGNQSFSILSTITSPNPIKARIIKLDDNTRNALNAKADLGIPQIDLGVLFNGTNASSSSVIATIWTMSDPESYFNQLIAHYGSNYSEFGRDDFRFITAVLTTSTFQTTSNINYSTQLNFTVQLSGTPSASATSSSLIPKVEATINGGTDHQQTVTLVGNNVIGYQWYMVCWENGLPTTPKIDDDFGANPRRSANCKSRGP
jgi:hypothetical protein